MMKAAWYDQCGAAADVLRVGQRGIPEPAAGEVRVRMEASGINPVDVKRRQGGRGVMGTARIVPHFDGAGVIDAVGEGVSAKRAGERVWIYEAQWQRNSGTAAEAVVLPGRLAVPLPAGTSFEEGACLGIPAMTAHRAVHASGEVHGKVLLITGGAGAVGNYAIQFARMAGAHVIATVSGIEKEAMARAAGAEAVLNYRTEDVAKRVMEITKGEGVDSVVEVEFGGNLGVSVEVLKVGGSINTYASEAVREPAVPFYQLLYKSITVNHILVFQMPEEAKRRAIDDIAAGLVAGTLRHQVGEAFALEDIAAAHEAVEAVEAEEAGAGGKVVVNRF